MAAPADLSARVGEVIAGRYKLLRIIGYGGMGAVFEAEHTAIRRPYAVKLLHPALGEREDIAKRFEREAIATGQLRHPSCVEVSDFGRLPDGALYLVMELLRGESLGDALDEGAFPVPRALHVIRQMLQGLEHAHSLDIVHRDIKPDNVLLVERGGQRDAVKLVDFGIAKMVGNSQADQTQLTQMGLTVGTPRYMAPEQAMGGTIDARTDLYSATVVLFEMVAGQTPFDGEAIQMITGHLSRPPPRLADVAKQPVSPELEAVVQRGLAKDPAHRFASAREYLSALEAASPAPTATPTPLPMPLPVHVPTPLPVHVPTPLPMAVPAEMTAHVQAAEAPVARPRKRWPLVLAAAAVLVVLIAVFSSRGESGPRVEDLLRDLEQGDTCELRRMAVNGLAEAGDAVAIPALKKARARRDNDCLRADAARAMERLKPR